ILPAQSEANRTLVAFVTGVADHLSPHIDTPLILDTFATSPVSLSSLSCTRSPSERRCQWRPDREGQFGRRNYASRQARAREVFVEYVGKTGFPGLVFGGGAELEPCRGRRRLPKEKTGPRRIEDGRHRVY